jgi:uncharacterized membrane protein YtjA (UPF0391 family)
MPGTSLALSPLKFRVQASSAPGSLQETPLMLRWALICLVIALVAAVLGFGGIAAGAASIAKFLFYIFLLIFVVSLIMGLVRRA